MTTRLHGWPAGLLCALGVHVCAWAQAADKAMVQVEAYASQQHLSSGYPRWHDVGLRALRETPQQLLRLELLRADRFGETGVFVGAGGLRHFGPDWFADLSVGAGDGAAYLPRVRIDGSLNRKVLPQRNLVLTGGAGYYRAPDGHTDRYLQAGVTWYLPVPLVVQAEVRANVSNPGGVSTYRRGVALTWNPAGRTQVVGRHAWGGEGYQSLGQGASLVSFRSRETTLTVRHWLTPQWALSLAAEHYRNPNYTRDGATLALIRRF